MNIYRYGPAWRALGIATVIIFIALPILIVLDGDDLELPLIAIDTTFLALGVWCYLYFRRYVLILEQEGFLLQRFARPPLRLAWREVISVSSDENELVLTTNTGRKVKISLHFPGYAAIEAATAANVADASYGAVGKPYIEPPTVDPVVLRERHSARRRMWLRMSRRSAGISVVLLSAAWLSSLVLGHASLSSLTEPLRTIVIWILAFAKVWGYGMAAWMALMSVLLFVMCLQEVHRFKKGLPPAV